MGIARGTGAETWVAAERRISLDGAGWSLRSSNGTEMVSNVSVPTDAHGADDGRPD